METLELTRDEVEVILGWADAAAPVNPSEWPTMRKLDEFVGIEWTPTEAAWASLGIPRRKVRDLAKALAVDARDKAERAICAARRRDECPLD